MPRDEDQSSNSQGNCAFCNIANGSTPSYTVFRDAVSMAFLDKRPLFHGHCLLIPLRHYETLMDLPKELIDPLFSNAKLLAAAVQEGSNADGTFIGINNIISQSVPHLHIHIVPRRHGDGLRGFFWPRQTYSAERNALEVKDAIESAISRLRRDSE